jgi:acyl phosphate:glycerol-3-phosphate acyltransferase
MDLAKYLWLIASYLVGSIPTGLIVSKAIYGVDLRKLGSGNIGATNIMRNFGFEPFLGVLILDMSKGVVAVLVARALGLSQPWVMACGLLSIVGHNWCIWLKFSGGKGIATSAGVILAAFPLPVIIATACAFFLLVLTTRIMSVSSLAAAAAFPVSTLVFYRGDLKENWAMLAFSLLAAAFAFWRHRENIRRLLKGEEPRISIKRKGGKA